MAKYLHKSTYTHIQFSLLFLTSVILTSTFSFQYQTKAMPKNAQTTAQLHSSHTLVGEGNGTPLQISCLENPVDGGAW